MKFKVDVGQHCIGPYKDWYQLIEMNGKGLEIQIHPKLAKMLGINKIGTVEIDIKKSE